MAIYMRINDVTGDVTTKGYEGWILLSSIDNGVSRAIETKVGRVADRDNAVPCFQAVELTKKIDLATPKLYQYACEATVMPVVEIHLCSTGKELMPYAKYQLHNVMISSYHESAIGEEHPHEIIVLNFTKIQKSYIQRNAQNQIGNPMTFGFDLEKAKRM